MTTKLPAALLLLFPFLIKAQIKSDTSSIQRWNFHFQQTVVAQGKPAMSASYSGQNSLSTNKELATSLTSTMYIGLRLWHNAAIYCNPEIAGGAGISKALGIAGFTNGETFRVGDPKPQVYIARAYIRQLFSLDDETERIDDQMNQLADKLPTSYVSFTFGKFGMADFYDVNKFSHDPRKQFLNWALMNNGAWDYPANTRGYTWGAMLELVKPTWAGRISSAMVPEVANGPYMDLDIQNAHSETVELEKSYSIHSQKGKIRLLGFYTHAHMGNYQEAIAIGNGLNETPDITATRTTGNTKYGIGINAEQDLSENVGIFMRAGWNDGKNETWAYTEIDQTASLGIVFNGKSWHRPFDALGIAAVVNGISADHRAYLKAGGYGFIIGDGNLNYGNEFITEIYYNALIHEDHFWLAPDYQFVLNPAYNMDRGPAHVFALRAHVEF